MWPADHFPVFRDLQDLMSATGTATVFLDRELRIQRFTPSATTLFNFISTDLGRPLSHFSCPLEYPEIVADAERSLTHLEPSEREVRAGEKWYIARTLPYRTSDDHIAGVVLTFTDTTTIKQGEEARARLAAIVESSSDAILGKDLRGIVTSWNVGAETMFGYTAAEMIGQSITRLIPAERQAEEVEILAKIGAGETIKSFDTVRVRKNGTTIRISATISPIKDAAGKIIGASKIARDISDAKQAEAALRQSEERLAFVRRSSGVGFWYCDLPFDVLQWDDLVKAHFHLPPDAAVTIQTFYDCIHPDDREPTRLAIERSIANRTPFNAVYRTVEPVSGAVTWIRAIGRTFYAEDGTPTRFDGVTLDVSGQKQAEQEIVRLAADSDRQRRLYETVLTNTPDFVYVFSLDYRVLYANDALLKMWGRGHEGAIGKTFLEIGYEPWHAEMHNREIDQVRATRQPIRGEVPFNGTNGRRLYEYIFVPVLGAAGEVEAVAGTTRDVTERKETERAIREGEERLRTALTSARMVAWEWTPADRKLRVSENAAEVFGLAPDVVLTGIDQGLALLHPDDLTAYQATFQKAIDNRTAYHTCYRLIRPDNRRVIWIEERGHTVFDRPDGGVRLYGVAMDVTERHEVEADLARMHAEVERERRLFDTALSNTTDFNFIFDPQGRFMYANRSLLGLWGKTTAQAAGKTMAELGYPPDVEAQLLGNIRRVIETRQEVRDETPYTSPTGETGHYEYSLAPVFDADGAVVQLVGSARDISDRKRSEDELRRLAAVLSEADRRKDEFLATLAHELRNPLAPIRYGLQVIRMSGANGTIEQAGSMMERQLTQLVRLVDDLLDVSRVTSGKLELRRSRVELRAVLDAAVETSRPVIEQAGHELTLALPDEPIWLDGDVIRLSQVVSNLLNNSAKYMHRGGNVRLKARLEDDTVIVSVGDDGIGIPPAMLDKVFEMFTQVDRALEKTTGGLGIGLSLVKALVEMHGGTIKALSEGEGRGSEFVVRLPAVLPVAQKVAPRQLDEQGGSSSRRRILVADDNVDSAKTLAKLLELLGNDVATAKDGLQAVEAAEAFRPDVILLDIGMPKLNGYEAARRIRGREWSQHTMLVALTGWSQEDDRKRSSEAGFDHHLVKPVEVAVLMKLLAGVTAKTK